MSVASSSWEQRLLDWAYEGILDRQEGHAPPLEDASLQRPYDRAAEITREHSRTFHLASALLPRGKRLAVRALYAVCRITDDLVDRPQGDPIAGLSAWRRELSGNGRNASDASLLAWLHTQASYGIPRVYAEQLIDGVASDLTQKRYGTFDELTAYCYGVASTVGLMAMHIIGFSGPEAVPYAVKLGVALQLTNILRDIAEDYADGRIYLPQEDLDSFDLGPEAILRGRVTDNWRAFMRFQIERVRALYNESMPGINMLNADGRMAIAAAAELYCGILDDIEARDMDVFRYRAHLTTWDKLRRLPGIWWRSNIRGYRAR